MDVKLILGLITVVLAIPTFLPYIRDILKRKTEPHTYTWLIWTVLQSIGVYAGFQDGGAMACGDWHWGHFFVHLYLFSPSNTVLRTFHVLICIV